MADLVVLVHSVFVLFVVFGGLLVLRWWKVIYLHLPAVAWGAFIEFAGGICPLTPLENALRSRAGVAGYKGGFVEHYILPALYPAGLTRNVQLVLGALVIGINLTIYAIVLRTRRGRIIPPSLPR
jgi:Protein of Unknown function (DUF2784)